MTDHHSAARLRADFDRSFAEAPSVRGEAPVGLLAVRVGDDPYAVRLSDVVALHRDVRVSPFVAGVTSALLGLAVFRGAAVPVYDLGELFGVGARPAPRWAVLVRAPSLVALAFDRFEAHAVVAAGAVVAAAPGGRPGALVRGAAVLGGASRPLVDVASVADAIGRLAGPVGEGL